jgi:hypothetical protein
VLCKLGFAGTWRPVQQHRTFCAAAKTLEDLLRAETAGCIQILERIVCDRRLEAIGQISRQGPLAAAHRLKDCLVPVGFFLGADQAGGLHRRFQLRAGNAVEREDLLGGRLAQAQSSQALLDFLLLRCALGFLQGSVEHESGYRVIWKAGDVGGEPHGRYTVGRQQILIERKTVVR